MFVIPALHPAFILRGQEHMLPLLEADLARAFRIAEQGWTPYERCWVVTPQEQAAGDHVRGLLRQWRAEHRTVAIDTETTSLDPFTCGLRIVGVSAVGGPEAVAFAWEGLPPALQEGLRNDLRDLAGDESCVKVFHNWTYDGRVLPRFGVHVRGPIFDSLVLSHVVSPPQPHDLQSVATEHLDIDPWKVSFHQAEKAGTANLEDLAYYCGRDAQATQRILEPLLSLVHEYQLESVVHYQTAWTELARRMEEWGIPISPTALERLGGPKDHPEEGELYKQREALLAPIRETFNWPDFSLTKPAHRRRLLYECLRLPVTRYTPQRREPATGYKVLLDYLGAPGVGGFVANYIKAYEVDHALRTYVLGFRKRMHGDGRLRVSWNTAGQLGSRFTSKPNAQNVPPALRILFEAPDGWAWVYADFAQVEYRVAAARAGARQLVEMFAKGVDTHNFIAHEAFGAMFDNLSPPEKKRIRLPVKRVVYGLQYGAQANRVFTVLREDRKIPVEVRALVTRDFVERVMRTFFRLAPEYTKWRSEVLEEVNRTGVLRVPPLGRTYWFPKLPAEGPVVWALGAQPPASDYANMSWLKIDERVSRHGGQLLINGHDSCAVLVPERYAERAKTDVEECMEWVVDGPAGGVRLYGEAKIGRNLKDIS